MVRRYNRHRCHGKRSIKVMNTERGDSVNGLRFP